MSNPFFTKRRYHNAGNKPDATVESFLKKQRFELSLCLGLGMPLGIFGVIGMVLTFRHPDTPSVWIMCLAVCFIVATPCIAFSLESYPNFKNCSRGLLGRWVITSHGIHHRFGKSPARFVAWSDVHAIRYDARNKRIILETVDTPLVISTWAQEPDNTPILPFLNKLIELLEPLPINIEPLLSLQEKERKKYIAETYCPVTNCFNELHLFLTRGLLTVGLGAAICFVLLTLIPSKLTYLGYVSGLYSSVCFVLTPISFYVCRTIKRYHEKKVETIYQSLLSGGTVGELNTQKNPTEFGQPPRIITAAARKRLCFGWVSILGWCLISIGAFFLILAVWDIGFILFCIMYNFPGWLLVLIEWFEGRKAVRLLERGVAVSGIIRKRAPNRIGIELPDEWGGTAMLGKGDSTRTMSVGNHVTVFIDPEKPKRRILFESTTAAVSYDITTNTFDSDSKLPYFQLPFLILFVIAVVVFAALLVK